MASEPPKADESAHASRPRIYDCIGVGYARLRQPDPRIARQIHAALGEAKTVLNVGAGTGSYEPRDRDVIALEPSKEMVAQRATGPVVRGVAESLPFRENQFDAALALLTVHHWVDARAGLRELTRVARRVVVFTFDPDWTGRFWLIREYVPAVIEFEDGRAPGIAMVADALGGARVEHVPVPHDCTDGFQAAYWRRPERYLDPRVRASISTFAQIPDAVLAPGLARLEADLASGAWADNHADLLRREEMDYGYRLLVAEERET